MIQANNYMNINRIEFSVTNACTSRCRHCSVGNVPNEMKTGIDKNVAVSIVKELSRKYKIKSVMTFGGEPLLYADTTCAIHKTATENGILNRQNVGNFPIQEDWTTLKQLQLILMEMLLFVVLLSVMYIVTT